MSRSSGGNEESGEEEERKLKEDSPGCQRRTLKSSGSLSVRGGNYT